MIPTDTATFAYTLLIDIIEMTRLVEQHMGPKIAAELAEPSVRALAIAQLQSEAPEAFFARVSQGTCYMIAAYTLMRLLELAEDSAPEFQAQKAEHLAHCRATLTSIQKYFHTDVLEEPPLQ